METKEKATPLKELIKLRGFTVVGLAAEMGIPHSTLYFWLTGATRPTVDKLDLLCEKLRCNRQEIALPPRKRKG